MKLAVEDAVHDSLAASSDFALIFEPRIVGQRLEQQGHDGGSGGGSGSARGRCGTHRRSASGDVFAKDSTLLGVPAAGGTDVLPVSFQRAYRES